MCTASSVLENAVSLMTSGEHVVRSVLLGAGFFFTSIISHPCPSPLPGRTRLRLPDTFTALEGLACLLSLRAEATAKALQTCYLPESSISLPSRGSPRALELEQLQGCGRLPAALSCMTKGPSERLPGLAAALPAWRSEKCCSEQQAPGGGLSPSSAIPWRTAS